MNRKAFVTGAGGFIGSHLVESLIEKEWEVKALVHYNSQSNFGWLRETLINDVKNLEVVLGDVSDAFQMQEAVKGCDVVFHLAALIGIPYSYHAPASYLNINVNGTLNLLEAALNNKVERFIHTSTSEVYGSAQYIPIDELHPLQAQSPYSASKIAGDKLVESFFCSFGLPVVTVRPFNTYGPRQSARAVVPTIITQALRGKVIRLGSLEPVRDLTFVTDTVSGFIAAAEAGEQVLGRVINLGTSAGVSIDELAQIIFEILGGDFAIQTDTERVRPPRSEVNRLLSNNIRALREINWRPTVSLREGLERTIDWLRQNQSAYITRDYVI